MSGERELKQTAGDNSEQYQAAGNIIVNKTEINYEERITFLKQLTDKYKEEVKNNTNTEFSGYIKRLERYINVADGELLDLTQKLTNAGYEKDLDWALRLKEQYAKMLQEHKFFKSSQQIHAFILARVIVLFQNHVLSTIRSGASQQVVRDVIYDKVIKQIESEIGGDYNVLELYSEDINGMIYFLTGNCHLVWK